METPPYVVVTNSHISHVYELYYKVFETLRRVLKIKTVDDKDRYCILVCETLSEHLTVIPRLAIGVLECQDLMSPEDINKLMNTFLRFVKSALAIYSRISVNMALSAYLPQIDCGATYCINGIISLTAS